jgi:glycosyltransferase involved in cell wall biosynthesis
MSCAATIKNCERGSEVRVLHICPYMHPAAGGPPVVVERLSLLTPAEGWEATIVTTSLYCDDSGRSLQESLGKSLDIRVLPIVGPRILKRAEGAVNVIDGAVQQADVVHLHTLWHPLNAIARKACQRHGRKYALMPHGMLDPYSLRQKRWRKKIYLAAVERKNLQRSSRLIFTTVHEQSAAQQSLPWLTPSEVIPLGADCPPDVSREACIATFTRLFPQAANRRCLLFLGRIHQKKGLDRLLKILPEISQKHPDTLLVIAGKGDAPYVEHIKRLVHAGGLEQQVLFTGMLTGQAKFGAFACAEVFLLPSRQENFAISMAEAMHMAVPVIISDKVNAWPLVKAANAGFVVEEEQIELGFAQRIDEILCDPDMAHRLGKCGNKFALEQLTWQRVARDMVAMYKKMLAE